MTIFAQARQRFDARTCSDFGLFLRRVVHTTSPGTTYQHNWHIDAIAAYLKACMAGEITRLIINMPPRMLKSTTVSVAWPAWLLGQNPAERIMVASYAQGLSTKHSVDCRLVMQSPWYRRMFAPTVLSADQNEKDKFTTTARGHRLAVSVGGAAIGEGGNVLIVDDPISPLQAGQAATRAMVSGWFDHTFVSRLDDKRKGVILVVMQRLHREDLSGYLLSKGGWEHLSLPALAEQRICVAMGGFRYERAAGEALHAARENTELLNKTKRELGAANFSAQYQQAPLKVTGTIIKPEWFPRFE